MPLDYTDLGQYRENNRIEAKKAQGGLPHSIWETYSAFANALGGVILLGVIETEDKSFASVPLPDPEGLAAEFLRLVNDPAVASINLLGPNDVRIVESEGNRIVVITVPPATRTQRPVYVGPSAACGTYRRCGEGDYRCSPEEVRQMFADRAAPDNA
ncbi:MAG: ATP-binding protein [Oscillospiraceae bacterium]|nr:ATP-binding protein [Oscillospiraceae bacterium]